MKKIENNPTIKRKLLKFIELKNLTKNEFYLRCGLSNGFLDKDRGFTTDNLVKILTSYPEIDVNWLLLSSDENPVLCENNTSQSVGNIENSTAIGVNVNGNGIVINPDPFKSLVDIVNSYQDQTDKFQNHIERLITIIENNLCTSK